MSGALLQWHHYGDVTWPFDNQPNNKLCMYDVTVVLDNVCIESQVFTLTLWKDIQCDQLWMLVNKWMMTVLLWEGNLWGYENLYENVFAIYIYRFSFILCLGILNTLFILGSVYIVLDT